MTLDALESSLGHRFACRELLVQALTHRSHGATHNERLEFLGDGVLNCCVAALLYRLFPDLKEGELSRLRASLVRQDALAEVARSLSLGGLLRLGEGELKSGGSARPSMLADALEALFGAIFLDGGFEAASTAIEKLFSPLLLTIDVTKPGKDAKTELQEYLQGRRLPLPRYELRATRGEAHAQQFDVGCVITELGIATDGTGASRRMAEQEAARRALEVVKAR